MNRRNQPDTLYLFVDEQYAFEDDLFIVRIAAIGIQRREFVALAPEIERLRTQGRRKGEGIASALASHDVVVTVSRSAVSTDLLDPERRYLIDNDRIAPRDFIWTQAFVYSVLSTITAAISSSSTSTPISVHYDPKSLRKVNRVALQNAIQHQILDALQKKLSDERPGEKLELQVERTEEVPKPDGGKSWTDLQIGTWIPDQLLRLQEHQLASLAESLNSPDFSDVVALVCNTAERAASD